MITLAARPPMAELYKLIDRVRQYPVSVEKLLRQAGSADVPSEVADFYGSFGDDQVFDNKEELIARTEQVALMRHEDADMPAEGLEIPEED